MKVWTTISEDVKNAGGRTVGGDTRYDGRDYMFRSVWNDEEHMDAFLEKYGDRISNTDRDYIGGVLTLFFSIKK